LALKDTKSPQLGEETNSAWETPNWKRKNLKEKKRRGTSTVNRTIQARGEGQTPSDDSPDV